MNNNKQAGRMILADLKMFNAAAILFEEEVQPEILAALADTQKDWAHERGWASDVNAEELTGSWLAPTAWSFKDENGEDDAHTWFEIAAKENSSAYHLANICGVGSAAMGIWFEVDERRFGGRRPWKKGMQAIAQKYVGRLKPLGFVYEEARFYLPLRLDASKLADAWADDIYDELCQPIITALDMLEKAVPIFSELIEEMRVKSPVQDSTAA